MSGYFKYFWTGRCAHNLLHILKVKLILSKNSINRLMELPSRLSKKYLTT